MLRDMSFERFEVFPITGALGAEVRGIDLAAAPDDASFEDLRRALHHYRVLAVRDQDLPPRHSMRSPAGSARSAAIPFTHRSTATRTLSASSASLTTPAR